MNYDANGFDIRACRICGCTDADCRQCIKRTGSPCYWVEEDLCSACATSDQRIEFLKTQILVAMEQYLHSPYEEALARLKVGLPVHIEGGVIL